MKVELRRLSGDYHLQATNKDGNTIETDASPDIGGTAKGMRPMELLLSAVGACSSIDVILIMKKKRQPLRDIKVSVTGNKLEGAIPEVFESIHVHYDLFGPVDPEKAERAIQLSMEKYCSVTRMVEKMAKMSWSYQIYE
jgi:putative redox protein